MKDTDTLESLEFSKVLGAVAGFSRSEATSGAVMAVRPMGNPGDIARRAALVEEIRKLRSEGTPPGISPFEDIRDAVHRARPEGAVLEAAELMAFVPVLESISSITSLLEGRQDVPLLSELASGLTGHPELLGALTRSIDGDGRILDTASRELGEIRGRIRGLDRKISRRLENLTRDAEVTPFLQDDFITRRSGRWVIPVRMDSKGMVKGVVHDVSRSGETAFMEPLEIIGLSNELENLIAEEKAEEIRILKSICRMVRVSAGDILGEFEALVHLDLLSCIAEFSDLLGMEAPEINSSSNIRLRRARHPLLMLHRGPGERTGVVPLDMDLGRQDRVMVITGPNAGGKTISIKTVGLLLLMALSGMPVPADSSSSLPLATDILVDIGDEQSIEANLSTFSAHVSNISRILERAGPGSIVLMDELGTGTDPQQGAALGSAVLKDLGEKGAMVMATTHLIDIVGFVHRTPGMVNASMEFDHHTMTPLYRLRTGEPGQSHALEIAEKFGLPRRVIESAASAMGTMQAEFSALVRDLKEKRTQYEEALEEFDKQREELSAKKKEAEKKLEVAEREKQGILERAYEEARGVVSEVKRKVYDILEEARRSKSRARMKELERAGREVDLKLRELRKDAVPEPGDIKEGETVFVRSIGYDARVLKVLSAQRRLRVKAGDKELEVPLHDIGPEAGLAPEKKVTLDLAGGEPVSQKLNLVGLRVDEALGLMEKFLNRASLAGLEEVVIVHGVGTGALKRAVGEHLEGHPLVEDFKSPPQAEGGAGVTVVRLR